MTNESNVTRVAKSYRRAPHVDQSEREKMDAIDLPIQFATDDPYTVRAAAIAIVVLFLAVSAGFYFAS